MAHAVFANRRDAGQQLAVRIAALVDTAPSPHNLLVLGLPRGGVPVAYEVAKALGAPLDVLPVRKLGLPGQEEYAMGAIAAVNGDFVQVLDNALLRRLPHAALSLDRVIARERAELVRRRKAYRGERPPLHLAGRDIVLVDDGLATGATMRAAVMAARQALAHRIIVAAPVGAVESCERLRLEGCECACVVEAEYLYGVGMWYHDFSPTEDHEVTQLLNEAERRHDHLLPPATELPQLT